jgi:hypothetical protein
MPEFGQMAPQGVHQRRPLANQEITAPMQHQHGLPLDALDPDKAHRRARDRFAVTVV